MRLLGSSTSILLLSSSFRKVYQSIFNFLLFSHVILSALSNKCTRASWYLFFSCKIPVGSSSRLRSVMFSFISFVPFQLLIILSNSSASLPDIRLSTFAIRNHASVKNSVANTYFRMPGISSLSSSQLSVLVRTQVLFLAITNFLIYVGAVFLIIRKYSTHAP